jgi:hypothetical protein
MKMKTVTLNKDNRSIMLVEDDVTVTLESNHVKKGSERVYGLSKDTVTLYEGVTAPEGWASSKYFFDGTDWTENPEYVELDEALPES